MHSVKKINSISGYKISLTFEDKKTKIVDIKPYLDKGIFLLLRDPDYFKLVKVKYGTIAWPNESDFCPDVLYEIGKEIQEVVKPSIRHNNTKITRKSSVTCKSSAMTKKRPKKV